VTVSPLAVDPRSYLLDDVVNVSIELEFVDADRELAEPPQGSLTAALISPSGASTSLEVEPSEEGETVTVTSTGPVTLDEAGIWLVSLTETDAGHIPGLPLVVEEIDGWNTLASARRIEWPDAPDDNATLYELLQSAREQCIEYAPPLPAGARVPARWRTAQLKQARAIWAGILTNGAREIGPDGIATSVYTMDVHVQQLLRPKQGRPRIR
jgi:hypothetical protein